MIRNLKLIIITVLTFLTGLTSCNNSSRMNNQDSVIKNLSNGEEKNSLLSNYPLLTWVRKSPVEIGCMLEKELAYRDSIFNCDYKNYVNNGDPCNNTEEYYKGIVFPNELAQNIDPSIEEVSLDFEHGSLREIRITFRDSLLRNQIVQMFNLPIAKENFPDNIIDISYGENTYSNEKPTNPDYTKWLTITGFEHIGYGEVDCE